MDDIIFHQRIMLNKMREPVSGLTHLFAAVLSLAGMAVLIFTGTGNLTKRISLYVYGFSLVFMFTSSAVYHLVNRGDEIKKRLRKLDHSAIFIQIAGTYTPICLFYFRGFWQWGMLTVIWLIAIAGVTVKIFIINAPRRLSTGIYLLMGWLSVMAVSEILKSFPASALFWLLLGGLFFTAGAIIYVLKKPDLFPGVFGFHEIWHLFVILGCLSHFILVAFYIAPDAY